MICRLPPTDVHSLLHADETEAADFPARCLEFESTAVVSDGQLDVLADSGKRDTESSRVAMYYPVSERLLGDAKQAQGDVRRKASELTFGREANLNVMPLFDLDAVRLQCRTEAEH